MDLTFKALNFATRAHKGQFRKKTEPDLPYIIHPVGVALILSKIDANEQTIAAGLLHDVIEDCGVTNEDLENKFGKEVARIVNDVTEQDKNLPWAERKEKAIAHIKDMQQDSLLVKTADSIHNLAEVIKAVERNGLSIFDKFNAPFEDQVEMFEKRNLALEQKWSENPILPKLKKLLDKFISFRKE